ncbi:hypothetical protein ABZ816_35620 [Actinosynnema sp. NPDC047251]|uniref:Putative membrane protein n=1 Tax=Saccharothrix espanaensis (strain ATCC 51144 / DSM 44229 / JCM 9112 / NBRC 15066 / NRRL 15764) TaxID=1179773 RepID=K0JUV9_SACES|nr:hypothetical protein [Saccharothrix espanaensis]CCH29302.1 putative membrane protein [Saccharothrix espanaensis DSM 44229]
MNEGSWSAWGRVQQGGPVAPIDIEDGRNAPGLEAMESLVNSIAMYVLVGGLAAVVIGIGIAVVGPRLGFQHARGVGIGGVVGGVFLGAVVGLASILVNFMYSVFSG